MCSCVHFNMHNVKPQQFHYLFPHWNCFGKIVTRKCLCFSINQGHKRTRRDLGQQLQIISTEIFIFSKLFRMFLVFMVKHCIIHHICTSIHARFIQKPNRFSHDDMTIYPKNWTKMVVFGCVVCWFDDKSSSFPPDWNLSSLLPLPFILFIVASLHYHLILLNKMEKAKIGNIVGTENNGAQRTKFTFDFMQELFQAPQFPQNLSHKPAYNFHFLPSLYILWGIFISYRIQYPVRGLEDELLCIFNILRNLQQQKHIKLDLNSVFVRFFSEKTMKSFTFISIKPNNFLLLFCTINYYLFHT